MTDQPTPAISIIIPIHNSEAWLAAALTSLEAQTLTDLEFILINDASTDSSEAMCREVMTRDPRCRLLQGPGQGAAAARNTGLDAARGRYIAFLDSDDWIEPEMMAELYDLIRRTESQVCLCNYFREYPGETRPVRLDHTGVLESEALQALILDLIGPPDITGPPTVVMGSVCRLLVERSFLTRHRIRFDPRVQLMEDLLFTLEILTRRPRVCIHPGLFYHYRIHRDSVAHRGRPDYFTIKVQVFDRVEAILLAGGWKKEARRRLETRWILLCLSALERGITGIAGTSWLSPEELRAIIADPRLRQSLVGLDPAALPPWERTLREAILKGELETIRDLFVGSPPHYDSMFPLSGI